MKTNFLHKNWQIGLYNILIILIFTFCYGHFGDVIVDSFREAYIPSRILDGQILYQNIFTIYAPFSYLFNALLYKIFGIHLRVLYFSGLIFTLGIFNFIFLVSKKFMPKTYALGIVLFCIAGGVLSPNVFNFIFPYSFGMLYGLFFIFASLYCVLNKKFLPAYILYSLAICNKYEFILFLPVLVYASGKKHLIKNFIALIVPILITFLPLFLSGLKLHNLIVTANILSAMSATKTLYWFYSVSGLIFRPQIIPIYIVNFCKTAAPILFLKFFNQWWSKIGIIIYTYFCIKQEALIFAFPLIAILLIIRFKKLNKAKLIVITGSLLVSAKVFFALTLQSYGVFFIPFALISLFLLIPKNFKKSFITALSLFSITLSVTNIHSLMGKSIPIQNEKGVIYTTPHYGNSINELIKYVSTNTQENETVVVYPECLIINFYTGKKSDDKFYSLIPLYTETFGEELIIKRLQNTKPENIIINNYNTSIYYYYYFGQDYANLILKYIQSQYKEDAPIGKNFVFLPFKLKN